MNNQTVKTLKQQQILEELNKNFGLNPERVLFLNPRDPNDPWIPADELESIARQTDCVQQISVLHDKFIPETGQVIYTATVVNNKGVTFTHPGVATVGENPNGYDIEADVLAGGRALSAALRAAGFHPYRSGSVVDIGSVREQVETKLSSEASEEESRNKDLKQIHALAAEKKLRTPEGDVAYRMWLMANYGVNTVIHFDAIQRAAVINALKVYENTFAELPDEMEREKAA